MGRERVSRAELRKGSSDGICDSRIVRFRHQPTKIDPFVTPVKYAEHLAWIHETRDRVAKKRMQVRIQSPLERAFREATNLRPLVRLALLPLIPFI